MRNSIKKLIFSVLGLVFTLTILFVLVEILLRIVDPANISLLTKQKKEIFYQDSFFHHFRYPNLDIVYDFTGEYAGTYQSDGNGFLLNHHYNKNENIDRNILIVGDSYVDAAQLDSPHRMSALIEKNAIENNDNLKSFNWGFSSYSPMIEERLIKKYWNQDIDEIVLVIWPLNDITADYTFRNVDYFSNRKKAIKPKSKLYIKHFYDLYIKAHLRSFAVKIIGKQALKKLGFKTEKWTKRGDVLSLKDNGEAIFNQKVSEDDIEAMKVTIRFLNQINDFLEIRNTKFHVAILPPGCYISKNQLENGYGPAGLYVWDESKENKVVYNTFVQFLEEEGFSLLDLLPVLKEEFERNQSQLYYPVDRHLNRLGHEICAKEIYENLLK